VVMRALAKAPQERFADAEAFLAALEAAERDPASPPPGSTATFAPLPPVEAPPEAIGDGRPPPDDEEEEERAHPWRWILGAVLLGLIAGLILSQRSSPQADVPDVIGQDLSDAKTVLQVQGFDVETETVRRLGPKDTVLEQDPPPGAADQDCDFLKISCTKPTVTLTVNAGPGQARVPRVAGLELFTAENRLREANFAIGEVDRIPSETVAAGIVIGTDPPGGVLAREGSEIALTVSSGLRQVEVPLVVGQTQAVAEAEIRGAGLLPIVQERADPAEAGQVLEQSPDAGNRVEEGSTVTIVVSKGEAQVTVPNVIGRTRSSAVSTLRAMGFSVSVQEEEVDVQSQNGKVIDQFPVPGSSATRGSSVTVFVGAFVAPAPPPTTTTPIVPAPRRG
jgi:beta-lactam-binding protein with PASTA domain